MVHLYHLQSDSTELVGIWISRYYNDISVFFHEAGEIYSMSELLSYASICT
ncbi:hypothetical protein DAI22_10g053600 [Oryza sativa Japonica Group]|nr:hypothetical protein DAI22_10g053600 [Oryza sativa Japonica Group]